MRMSSDGAIVLRHWPNCSGGEDAAATWAQLRPVGVGELAVLACDAAAFAAYAVGLLLVERHFAAAFAYGLFVLAADDDHAPVAMVAGVAVLRLCGLLLCRGAGSDRHAYGGEGRENTLFHSRIRLSCSSFRIRSRDRDSVSFCCKGSTKNAKTVRSGG